VFRTGLRPEAVPLLIYDGLSLLHAVAGQRVRLPDADPGRFLIDEGGRPWLCSLAGAIEAAPPEAYAAHAILAVRWCESVLEQSRRFDPPPALRRLLTGEPGWDDLFDAWAQVL
jgi:hypothetical protein